jgi:hypothetical protein
MSTTTKKPANIETHPEIFLDMLACTEDNPAVLDKILRDGCLVKRSGDVIYNDEDVFPSPFASELLN